MDHEVVLIIIGLVLALLVLPIFSLVKMFLVSRQTRELADAVRTMQRVLQRELAELRAKSGTPDMVPTSPVEHAASAKLAAATPARAAAPMPVPAMPAVPPPVPPVVPPPPPVPTPASARTRPAPEQAVKPPPREPSAFEAAARRILLSTWNWIIVGEEHRPQGVSMEYAVATNWLLRLGVLIFVVGIGFFLRYSFEHGLIGPLGRVSISLLTGAALLGVGIRLLGRPYHLLGQGLLGAGLATLYFSVFAASSFYHLIDILPAFALMALVTVSAGFMAVRFGSMLVAVLGIVGGYGTPVMLSTGQAQFTGLFSYMLLLGAGVFGIAYRKNWHLLNFLSFACTYALFFAALDRHYTVAHFGEVMPFLLAFFALFSTLAFVNNLVRRRKSNLLDVLALIANAGICFGAGYGLVREAYGREWVAALTLGLAAFYTLHVQACLARRLQDRPLVTAFIGLASFFLVVTIPLILSGEWITVSWALEAFILLWMAGRLNSVFLQQVAYLLYVLLLGRFFFLDLPGQFGDVAAPASLAVYGRQLASRLVMFGVPILSIAGANRLLRRPVSAGDLALDASNNVSDWVRQHWAVRAFLVCFSLCLFVYLHLELNRSVHVVYDPLRLPVLTALWLVPCAMLVGTCRAAAAGAWAWVLMGVLLAVVVGKLVVLDMASWHFHPEGALYARTDYSALDAGMRLLDFGLVLAFLFYAFRAFRGGAADRNAAAAMGYAGLGLLFLYATLETNTFLHFFVRGLQSGGVSVLWSAFALAFVLAGILKSLRGLRFTGLALFVVVFVKVFSVDLRHLEQVYRIVAFIVLGIVLLAGSFVYLKFRTRFTLGKDAGR